MGADLYFMALASEQLTVVSEREHCCCATSNMSAIYWTCELKATVNCSFGSGTVLENSAEVLALFVLASSVLCVS